MTDEGSTFNLRRVRFEDCEWIGDLANEPSVRSASFSSDPISYEDHCRWFSVRMSDSETVMYVAESPDRIPLGQVRFQLEGCKAVISVSVVPEARGGGFGSRLIRAGAERLFSETPVNTIEAYIKKGNPASIRAFEKAGFLPVGNMEIHGVPAVSACLDRAKIEQEQQI